MIFRAGLTNPTIQADCNRSWQLSSGPYICAPENIERFMEPSLSYQQFPRLCGFMDALIQSQVQSGKDKSTVRVCMAGHGEIDRFAMEALVDRGVSVVSRESDRCQADLLRRSLPLASAVERGQLILSSFDKHHPSFSYDIVVWVHPNPLDHIDIGQNVVRGGLVMVQTEHISYLGMNVNQYELIFSRSNLSPSNYVFYSGYLNAIEPNYLRIWRKRR